MTEIYFSTDIESDGPIPGPNSMLSFGSAAFSLNGELLSTFSRNLETLSGAIPNPDTMAWWQTQKTAWEACRKDTIEPKSAMIEYSNWIETLCTQHKAKPVFVGFPAGYDFLFIYWYLIFFTGRSPFSFSAYDIKSVAALFLNIDYRNATKRNFPKRWFDKSVKHTHVALDDAIEQGILFCNILKERKGIK